jgi:NADP-dependent 3-hydroxy acid dehydrogenase YdfG
MINTNLLGLMYMTHTVLPGMVQRGAGDIVNVSSVAGRTTRAGSAGYNTSKRAVSASRRRPAAAHR